jgi:hypothetical protein
MGTSIRIVNGRGEAFESAAQSVASYSIFQLHRVTMGNN